MPELPDLTVYKEAVSRRIAGARLVDASVRSPFLLRTFEPPLEAVVGDTVDRVSLCGKRIAIHLVRGPILCLHLMIAGRLLYKPPGAKPKGKIDLASFEFDGPQAGTLILTEASQQKRAALHVLPDAAALAAMHPGGVDPLNASTAEIDRALTAEDRTVKRVLTDQRRFAGIGNAYSDEILHWARVSPLRRTGSLSERDRGALHTAIPDVIRHWTSRLIAEFSLDGASPGRFPGPGEITAFRPDFAVHGRYGKPCPTCGAPVQRLIRADNEVNYCAVCQNDGRILADRSMSRLLRDDWPRSIEEWEAHFGG